MYSLCLQGKKVENVVAFERSSQHRKLLSLKVTLLFCVLTRNWLMIEVFVEKARSYQSPPSNVSVGSLTVVGDRNIHHDVTMFFSGPKVKDLWFARNIATYLWSRFTRWRTSKWSRFFCTVYAKPWSLGRYISKNTDGASWGVFKILAVCVCEVYSNFCSSLKKILSARLRVLHLLAEPCAEAASTPQVPPSIVEERIYVCFPSFTIPRSIN